MLFLFTNIFLMSNALTNRRDKSILFSRTAMFFFIALSFSLYSNTSIILLAKGIALYSGLFFIKPYVYSFSLFLYIITCIILSLTSFYPYIFVEEKVKNFHNSNLLNSDSDSVNNSNTKNYYKIIFNLLEEYKIIEYALIIVFVINGASLLMCSNDIISIFLAIELQSYGLYLLCAVYRDSELSINAGLTYFLLGGLSSCIILLGQSLLYINSGNTNLDGLYIINNVSESINYLFKDSSNISDNLGIINTYQYYIHISLVLMSVGFLFKISSAPFHFWSPFVYDAIPTKVTTFVAIVAKISILIFFYELVYYTNYTIFNITWKNNLILSSLLSLIIGSILGLTQTRIKRLYAYSTISHLGFILLTLSIRSVESTQAFFFYILQYSISNLNAFITLIAIGYSSYLLLRFYKIDKYDLEKVIINHKDSKTSVTSNILSHATNIKLNIDEKKLNTAQNSELRDINLSPIQLISQIKGYYEINPILAVSLGLTLFSFLGVPPLVGFFGKQMVLSAALDRGYIFMTLIAILTSVISAVYYLFIIKQLFFEENKDLYKKDSVLFYVTSSSSDNKYRYFYYKDMLFSSSLANIISIITLLLTLFIFISKETINLVNILSLFIFYID